MPRDLADTVGKEAYYPDELPDLGTIELLERAVYEPDEVDLEEAQYGLWFRADDGTGEIWISAPSELREAVHETQADVFRVETAEKGPKDHDPYHIEIEADPQHH